MFWIMQWFILLWISSCFEKRSALYLSRPNIILHFALLLGQALGILKAALISKTALTDGLIKPMLKKEPKKEPKEEPMEKRWVSTNLDKLFPFCWF